MSTPERRSRLWLRLTYTAYQHATGVFGGFALAAMLGHILDLGWRGAIAQFVGYWDDYVRPVVRTALNAIIVVPLGWLFGWHFEIPLIVRDYVSVGVIFALSVLRALHRPGQPWEKSDAVIFVGCLFGWPGYVPVFGWTAFQSKTHRVWMLLALLPVVYLVLLLSVNYMLPA